MGRTFSYHNKIVPLPSSLGKSSSGHYPLALLKAINMQKVRPRALHNDRRCNYGLCSSPTLTDKPLLLLHNEPTHVTMDKNRRVAISSISSCPLSQITIWFRGCRNRWRQDCALIIPRAKHYSNMNEGGKYLYNALSQRTRPE